jgi:hypothetical protein
VCRYHTEMKEELKREDPLGALVIFDRFVSAFSSLHCLAWRILSRLMRLMRPVQCVSIIEEESEKKKRRSLSETE